MVTSDGLKPSAAPQSPCVPPTSVCPLLRGHLRGPRGLCGTFAGFGAVDADIVYAKLSAMAEGAATVDGG